jgi:lipopolysaccharide transport system ATP-binding protein
MNTPVIQVENLSKSYRIGSAIHQKNLRESISAGITAPLRWMAGNQPDSARAEKSDQFWALKDISFSVEQGEVLGVIGRNGAGKSTLLKILSRITKPTEGRARIRGRVGSLLEVGTGFHPELTGRENVFLSGAILGMARSEIVQKFDEIIAFAEIEQFLDTPVKHYSSGMYMRLAFAVAAHLEPEILIVDEVLAVGDIQFQKKCLGKMGRVAKEGRTVIFVSHNMAAVSTLCSTALVIDRGQIVCEGDTGDCISTFGGKMMSNAEASWSRPSTLPATDLTICQVTSLLEGQQPHLSLDLDILLESRTRHKPAFIAVDILDATSTALMQALPSLEGFMEYSALQHRVKVSIDLPPLVPGQYFATIWAGSHNTETLDEVKEVVAFEIYESPTPGRSYPHTKEHGAIVPLSSVRYFGNGGEMGIRKLISTVDG